MGSKKNAIWRVVVADRRSPRDGRFIEMIGHYNPQTHPSQIVIDEERLQHWLERGAEPSNTVKKLMRAKSSDAGATADGPQDEPPAAEADSPPSEADSPPADPEAGSADAGAGPDAEAGADAEADAGAETPDESAEPEAADEGADSSSESDAESG